MLQADAAAAVQERLEVLIVVVQLVLLAEQGLDQLRVGDAGLRLQRLDVAEAPDAAGDVGGPKRLALERGHDPDQVLHAVRRDHLDAQLIWLQPERLRRQRPAREDLQIDRPAVRLARGDHEERDRVDRRQSAGRQHGPLNALLALAGEKRLEIGEVAELRPVDG